MSGQSTNVPCDPIAIVGVGCRFPGQVNSAQVFWELLVTETNAVREVSAQRWDIRRYYHPDSAQAGRFYTLKGGFLEQIDQFDSAFFGIPPVEATRMDPQQRLLLEVSWEALEDAGLVPGQLAGSQAGVFIGTCSNDYFRIQDDLANINAYSNAGSAISIATNRISYQFDFRGPSFSVDTACSSSLVAVHLACESLWRNECSLALAGGANILLDPVVSVGFCKAHMLSPRGQCHSFSAEADGYVRGEGVGIVVLKPLSQALANKDPIYALILATSINQDGRTQGMFQPSGIAQETLLRQIYKKADISPSQVHYVEAHGTGTIIGDYVECHALGAVFGEQREVEQRLRIGSVKTNIGHLEGASGIAGLIKVALMLKHRQIPASLHFERPNPRIDFEQLKLQVQRRTETLAPAPPLIAGINSFGFGGTNAHAILQEFTPAIHEQEKPSANHPIFLLPLSARTPEALQALAASYLNLLHSASVPSLRDICFTASMRREQHAHRLALVVRTHHELTEKLEAFLAGEKLSGMVDGHAKAEQNERVAFVFCGNGSQWWAMGRHLLEQETLFRSVVEHCSQLLQPYTGWSLIEEMMADEASSCMDRTDVAQPALFALQIALVALWKSWGIEPQAVIGHSVGEVAAAYVAGALSLEDAVYVMYQRSRLQELTAGQGTMVAVGLSPREVLDLIIPCEGRVSLASINAPRSVTLTGDTATLEHITSSLLQQGVFCRFLKLNYAFHSRAMDSIRQELLASLQNLQPQAPRLPFISTVTGDEVVGPICDADYWWRNVRRPVQFAAGIEYLIDNGITTFLEIGPHPVLSAYIAECLAEKKGHIHSSLRRNEDEQQCLLTTLGALYTRGYPLVWLTLIPDGKHVPLPLYPWQHESYWFPATADKKRKYTHPLLGYKLAAASTIWENNLEDHHLCYLADHRVGDVILFPAAGYLEMILAMAFDLFGEGGYAFQHLKIHKPLMLGNTMTTVQTVLSSEDHSFQIHSQLQKQQSTWTTHATGQIGQLYRARPAPFDLDLALRRCDRELSAAQFYQECSRNGLQFGPAFRLLERLYLGEQDVIGVVRMPENAENLFAEYHFHPTLLDCCIQAIAPIAYLHQRDERYTAYLPVEIECFRCYTLDLPSTHLYCHVHLVEHGSNYGIANCTIFGEDGQVIAELLGLREQAVRLAHNGQFSTLTEYLYEERWQFSPLCSWQHVTDSLPTPLQVNAWLQTESKRENQEDEVLIQQYREMKLSQQRLCIAYMIAALRQLGWDFRVGEAFNPGLAVRYLGIDPHYKQLLALWCMALADAGILQQTEDAWVVARIPDSVDPESCLRDLLFAAPAGHADLLLLTRCGRRLATILQGQVDPLTVVSSNGDFGTLEHFYESGADTKDDNRLVQEALRHIIDHLPAYRNIRVLEIGAGTGGTTAHLLPLLPADRTTYVFSDVSELALQTAQQKYHKYPFVCYELLDIGLDPQQQGFEMQSFDIIIASHVVHLTRDVHETLHHIHSLLTSEGLFFLVEPTNAHNPLMLLVFGLLKDYWTFQDSTLRPLQPLLSEEQWLRELSKAGFVNTTVLSHPHSGEQLNTALLLAQNPCFEQQSPLAISPATGASGQNWIIFADDSGLAERVQQMLAPSAEHIILVKKRTHYHRSAPSSFVLRPGCTEDMQLMLQTLSAEGLIGHHLVYLWGVDSTTDEITSASLDATLDIGCLSLIGIVQALLETHWKAYLWIITSGVYTLTTTEPLSSIEQAPLYGLSRVIMNEHPKLNCTLIDIGVAQGQKGKLIYRPAEIHSLVEELRAQAGESEVLLRDTARFVNRIVRTPHVRQIRASEAAAMPDTRYFLDVPAPGALDNLVIRTAHRLKPGLGMVEVAPSVTGLNFKDVALAMGLLPAKAQVRYSDTTDYALGLECVGKITALGEGVTNFNVGDEVFGFGYHSFSSSVIADAQLLVRKPTYMSAEEAATIVTTFVTAHYALHHLAQLRQGERVLIHGAAGGVGLAAIQIVQHAGGEIIATAGSAEKREYLRSLGIQHVLDSRSLAFADEIMQLTNGQGVHVVLNSLAGEAMRKSLAVLQRFGRFLEIGKRDFLENSKLGLQDFNRCLSYFAIDIGEMITWDRERVTQVLHEVAERFEQGIYRSLPYRLFALSQIVDAFRYMQQSRHIGKIVVSMQDQYASVQQAPPAQVSKFRADASYLITGGLSGFGLKTAQWMVEHGARHLVLVSRSGASTPEAQQAVQEMQVAGIQVLVAQADVTREEEVIELLERLTATYPPLRGIMHAAMVLEDRPVRQLDATTLKKVVAPKMLGAWNLHKHTLAMPLEFFVLFSSISALLGNIGQGNYAAGNLFLEALARYRVAQGLPALAVEWGALAQVGYVARHSQIHAHLERSGIQAMSPDQALTLLGRFLQEKQTQITIAKVDWGRLKMLSSSLSVTTRWTHLLSQEQEQPEILEQPEKNLRVILLKMTGEERQEFMRTRLNKMLASILGISASRLDTQQLTADMGIDSLTAMELRSQIQQDMSVDIPMMHLLQKQSISDLATTLTEQLVAEPTTEADSLLLTT